MRLWRWGGDHRWKLAAEVGWVAERLAAAPELTLAEVRGELEARGVLVSYSGVQRTVRRLGLGFKKIDLCDGAGSAWRRLGTPAVASIASRSGLHPPCFVDQTGTNTAMTRTHGWG